MNLSQKKNHQIDLYKRFSLHERQNTLQLSKNEHKNKLSFMVKC